MDNLNRVTKRYEVKLKATFILRQVNCKVKITIDGQTVEQADHFKCLGSIMLEDGYDKEIKSRIAM